ncbi:pilus assembly protein [Undibacterium oligocarboniphilum]|uniref:Pilus assembly protein PilY n=1 Tax=Undibacterium oligocarboniphilum TaxID=666702 RepID=A0A850QM75_9BURK|nr:PilC/PilY family type IV pilus protein [Undibacterium oligocarboniphilum]MBC3870494.1 pilus assembly protein PilY [Undibacterium oligocarboniphilum]NVO78705.1 pilus assembly protein PilY [Undibacterium oligocarboniphilum]
MKFSRFFHTILLALLALSAFTSQAADTDIFNQPPGVTPPAPNIIFILDNTANWSKASQKWSGSPTQGQAELIAIKNFVAGLTQPANVGLMMFDVSTKDGSYVRYGVRSMSVSNNNAALQDIVSYISANVNSPSEKINQSSGDYANALYETWLYLTGANSWAGMAANADYSGNAVSHTPAGEGLSSNFAYKGSANGSAYNTPINTNGCAKTYIIFIGNNRQGQLPPTPSASDPAATTLTAYHYTSTPDVQSAWARFLHLRPDLTPGSVAATNGSVTTYTIDAYNAQQNVAFTSMMKNMAKNGGGQYFQAGSDQALAAALQNILAQIQAVNSVFASASLPVSVSVRGSYLNQVYLGVFRPDPMAAPNWVGNLKQYQLGVDTATTPPTLFLADSLGAPVENQTTGFINPSAVSFWTQSSTFWDPSYYVNSQGVGGNSDSPDGDLVEKGAAAQYVRTTYATSQTSRNIYTCTGNCTGGSLLSATPFDTSNSAITNTMLGATSTADHDSIINWVRGGNTQLDDNPSPVATTSYIRGFNHGDVLHSRPAVVNYNRTADDVMLFYGGNDGILHAIKGGQNISNNDGSELWGFIASEHFPQFKRMRDHAPLISTTNPKPYFMDGSATVYTYSSAGDGKIDYTRGDKAYLFVTMRRGGRFVYALDVSNPAAPKFLWKHSNTDTGFTELGQTWSDMRVAKLRYQANPVLIFGMGYDATANDPIIQGTATMGRGVMVLDATTGALIWQAGTSVSGALYNLTVPGMSYAIPSNVALYDSNGDGNIDRIYVADTGANVWRINVDDAMPANWTVTKLASLGGTGINARKFLYPPDIIPATTSNNFDSLLIGSGDREHPFDTTIQNRYYMIKDDHSLNAVRATPIIEGAAGSTTGVSGQLYDVTADTVQMGTAAQVAATNTALTTASGWYVALSPGEKVVSGSTTLAGTVVFATNLPATAATNTCTGNLGEARIYMLNYLNGASTFDVNQSHTLTITDRYSVRAGGGYPPTPVPISVQINGKTYQGVISGTKVITPPAPTLGRRYRTYWQRNID